MVSFERMVSGDVHTSTRHPELVSTCSHRSPGRSLVTTTRLVPSGLCTYVVGVYARSSFNPCVLHDKDNSTLYGPTSTGMPDTAADVVIVDDRHCTSARGAGYGRASLQIDANMPKAAQHLRGCVPIVVQRNRSCAVLVAIARIDTKATTTAALTQD